MSGLHTVRVVVRSLLLLFSVALGEAMGVSCHLRTAPATQHSLGVTTIFVTVLVGAHVTRQVMPLAEALAADVAFEPLVATLLVGVGLPLVLRAHVVDQVRGHAEGDVALGTHVLAGLAQGGQGGRHQGRDGRLRQEGGCGTQFGGVSWRRPGSEAVRERGKG